MRGVNQAAFDILMTQDIAEHSVKSAFFAVLTSEFPLLFLFFSQWGPSHHVPLESRRRVSTGQIVEERLRIHLGRECGIHHRTEQVGEIHAGELAHRVDLAKSGDF